MKRVPFTLALGALAVAVAGCDSMRPEDFARGTPVFRLEEYFAGETRAWGLFQNRFGDVDRQFVTDLTGKWDGKQLVLDERFTFADGEQDERVWHIVRIDDHHYEGGAGDVVGTAFGSAYGNALNWRYVLDLKVGDGTRRLNFDDWMFLQPDGILVTRTRVSKWGVEVGELTVVFGKRERGAETADGGSGGSVPTAEAVAASGPRIDLPGALRNAERD